ncbi:MAG: hypothetical protein HOB82_07190 [Alphaproteobacteria bacterium]|nr:hypothetical protein [Alphaproteobacteria bacterium]MBT4711295.1 hypothetical protein [Alphaproteobacteria bacterium]
MTDATLRGGLRKALARWVKPHPWAYRILVGTWNGGFGLWSFARAAVSGRLWQGRNDAKLGEYLGRQSVLEFPSDLDFSHGVDGLRADLERLGIPFNEGGWTFYLPPSTARDAALPSLADQFPGTIGLKILKDLRDPMHAVYTPHDANPAPGAALLRKMTPAPIALVRVASALSEAGIGARVHDIVQLNSAGASATAYVVDHLGGGAPTADHHAEFLDRLSQILDQGDLVTAIPSIKNALDFAAPDCNGNLILDNDGVPRYVDFQAFAFANERRAIAGVADREAQVTHFGRSRLHRPGKYLYQGIPGLSPGKRDVPMRWATYGQMLEQSNVDLAGHVAIDVGCNAGLMLYEAVASGARWGVGWDMPDVAAAARRLLASFGVTRATIIGGEISDTTDFAGGIPPHLVDAPCILFHLAVSDHVGFPPSLAAVPWTYMVYEGHADQDIQHARDELAAVDWLDGDVIQSRMVGDGDSPARPVLLLKR